MVFYEISYKMKFYVTNYKIGDLFGRINEFEKYYKYTKEIIYIYADEGIFTVDDGKLYRLNISDNDECKKIGDLDFIIDSSLIEKEQVYQLPYNHTIMKTTQFYFAPSVKSNVKLVLEGTYNKLSSSLFPRRVGPQYKYDGFSPSNFYFEVIDKESGSIKDDLAIFL